MAINYKTIDFSEIDQNGDDFELLVRELLHNEGYEVYWSGKGSDGGKDLLCIEQNKSIFKQHATRWLVQCKHNANSGRAVNGNDIGTIGGIANCCSGNDADGYILICSTFPSSAVVRMLDGIEKNEKIKTCFWDYHTLENKLLSPQNWSLITRFFPESAEKMRVRINPVSDYLWQVYYKGYVFYIALRLSNNIDRCISLFLKQVDKLSNLSLPEKVYIRIRAIYYDDKYTNLKVYYDILVDEKIIDKVKLSDEAIEFVNDYWSDGLIWQSDVHVYPCRFFSDSFDIDSQCYYSPYIRHFSSGVNREEQRSYRDIVYYDNPMLLTLKNVNDIYNKFVTCLKKLPFISILNAQNACLERLDCYSSKFNLWKTINCLGETEYNFFEVIIRFKCDEFEKLKGLLNTLPQDMEAYFTLDKNFIFLPDEGYDTYGDNIYTLRFSVNSCALNSPVMYRMAINDYLRKLTEKIEEYLCLNGV